MLKITRLEQNASGPLLKLEGKLLGPWVDEVRRACADLGADLGPARLDLGAVTFVDAAGVRLLRELLRRNVALDPCSGFVAALLWGEES